jgi:organic radical activating enzyme
MSNDYMSEVRQTGRELNAVSSSLCLAKWSMATIHLQQGETHSCYHPWTHKIPIQEIKNNPTALHNTEYKKEQRKKMLNNTRPKECQYCWNIEDLNKDHISDRLIRSHEPWAKQDFKKIVSNPWDQNINPRHLEISFDSVCQLKCIYCNPTVSSKWYEEVKEHGGYKTSEKFNDFLPPNQVLLQENKSAFDESPYVQAFWEWWPSLYPDLRHLRITGGEPLLSKNTFKVLDYVSTNAHPDLSLIINSNLCVADGLIDKLIQSAQAALQKKKIKAFTVFGSIDTFGEQAEYIRTGLSFDRFMKNVERILVEVPDSQIAFTVTYNILSVPGFEKLLALILKLREKYHTPEKPERILFDTPYLRFPTHLCVQALPNDYIPYLKSQITFMKNNQQPLFGFSNLEIEKLHRLMDWMYEGMKNDVLVNARKDFAIYFAEHDKRRNTNFEKTFPELLNYLTLCQSS